jgi:hypothetical protein
MGSIYIIIFKNSENFKKIIKIINYQKGLKTPEKILKIELKL